MTAKIFFDLPGAAEALSVSESTIQKLTREDPDFPKPRKISKNRVGYLVREIQVFAESRPVSELPPPANCDWRRKKPQAA
jgi:prophage regulatory protein